MNYNKVILGGNMTRDCEIRYTPKGTAVANFGIAINRKWTNEAGEAKDEVTFIDVTAFGKTAENLGQYKRKGDPLLIDGRLKLDVWTDKQSGANRQKLSVVAETIQYLNRAQPNEGGEPSEPRERRGNPPPRPQAAATETDTPPYEGDDVPW